MLFVGSILRQLCASATYVCCSVAVSLLTAEHLALHRYNLAVHESALPQGQGWSPMTWQILEGASSIPITLFEAVADLDAGPIYLQQQITLRVTSWWTSGVPYRPVQLWNFV